MKLNSRDLLQLSPARFTASYGGTIPDTGILFLQSISPYLDEEDNFYLPSENIAAFFLWTSPQKLIQTLLKLQDFQFQNDAFQLLSLSLTPTGTIYHVNFPELDRLLPIASQYRKEQLQRKGYTSAIMPGMMGV